MKVLRLPERFPEGEPLWRHEAGPPSATPNLDAVREYLAANGIDPHQARAVEFYRDGNHGMLRVECYAVSPPPGFEYEEE